MIDPKTCFRNNQLELAVPYQAKRAHYAPFVSKLLLNFADLHKVQTVDRTRYLDVLREAILGSALDYLVLHENISETTTSATESLFQVMKEGQASIRLTSLSMFVSIPRLFYQRFSFEGLARCSRLQHIDLNFVDPLRISSNELIQQLPPSILSLVIRNTTRRDDLIDAQSWKQAFESIHFLPLLETIDIGPSGIIGYPLGSTVMEDTRRLRPLKSAHLSCDPDLDTRQLELLSRLTHLHLTINKDLSDAFKSLSPAALPLLESCTIRFMSSFAYAEPVLAFLEQRPISALHIEYKGLRCNHQIWNQQCFESLSSMTLLKKLRLDRIEAHSHVDLSSLHPWLYL